mmetsp:Transcript_50661/g.94361  ORF Transcript_50661/g.94361 Transcript_50661/m.94361 type:complete len:236 (-) Transcript_50661:1656-2363(-)
MELTGVVGSSEPTKPDCGIDTSVHGTQQVHDASRDRTDSDLVQFPEDIKLSKLSRRAGDDWEDPLFHSKAKPEDFELLCVVGQGTYGKVFQAMKKDTREIVAMKVMQKERILLRNKEIYVQAMTAGSESSPWTASGRPSALRHTFAERNILSKIHHPYIVSLRSAFTTSTKLYLVLDFVNGGHLFFQLYRHGMFTDSVARHYTAQIVLAVAHLHKLNIIHRDLKCVMIALQSELN